MSADIIEFFWDVGSPYTYLASTQIDRIGLLPKLFFTTRSPRGRPWGQYCVMKSLKSFKL